MAESIMLEKAKDFAVDIIRLCRALKETKCERHMIDQLLRCGTSIGANISESKYASSMQDFISKMQISLKECNECEYWLELMNRTDSLPDEYYHNMRNKCGAIRRMLISSINTTRSHNK